MFLFSISLSSIGLVRKGIAGAMLALAGLVTTAGSEKSELVKTNIPEFVKPEQMNLRQNDFSRQALPPQNQINNSEIINSLQSLLSGGFRPFVNVPILFKEIKYVEPEISVNFRKLSGFQKREQYIKDVLEVLNPHLLQDSHVFGKKTALSEFNRTHNMNFECLSIRGKPCEFVLIDKNYFLKSGIGKTNIPRRISVSLEEAKTIQSKESVINLLEWKLLEHERLYASENKMWNTPFRFDFPKDKGACMLTLMLNPDCGMETDVIYALNVYTKEFGMSTYTLPVGDVHYYDMLNELQKNGYENLAKNLVSAKKNSILDNLESSLRKAVDDKKEFFVFHYLTHGSSDGAICAEDEKFDPIQVAEVLSRSYKDSSFCGKLDIYVQAGACYSGKELRRIVNYFKENKNIPVKNLYIISESNNTTATFSSTWQRVSLIQDEPLVNDMTGPQAYFDSWVKSYSEYLKSKGEEVRPEVTTMLWRYRFADLMTWYDEEQDMKGIHYSNDPKKNKTTHEYFTELTPQTSENLDSQSLYAQLEDLKDVTPGLRWSQYLNNIRDSVA